MKKLKKIIVGVMGLVFLFSTITQVPTVAQAKNENLSDLLTSVFGLDSKFDNTIGLDGDFFALDAILATKQGATDSEIKSAILKVNEINQITEDITTLQPFVREDENGFSLDEESARKANVSEDLIVTTVKDFELLNSIEPLAACNGRSEFVKDSEGFYTYFDSCETAQIITYI